MAQRHGLHQDEFQELHEIDWILLRPDSYVGSMDKTPRTMFCYNINDPDVKERRIRAKTVSIPEALDAIYCEILGNAADNVLRSRDELGIDPIQIEITMTETTVTVKNYGCCIPVQQKQWLNTFEWIPTQAFTSLRTSSNYDDKKVRMYVGRNGLGAKLTGVFSQEVYFECADPGNGLILKQRVSRNRSIIHPPEITSYPNHLPGYTLYQFQPDFPRFQYSSFDQEILEVFAAHAVEVAYARSIPVIFNGTSIKITNLHELTKYFFSVSRSNIIEYSDPNGVFHLCMMDTPNEAVTMSLANGMITREGGIHVDEAYHVIVERVKEILGKSLDASGVQLTKRDFINHVSIFLSVHVNQPKYDRQTKSKLTGPTSFKIVIPPDVLKGIKKWHLIEQIYLSIEQKKMNKIRKSEAENRREGRVRGPGITPRNFNSGVPLEETAAILMEGLSCKQYTERYISFVPNRRGHDYFGVLPLHGKIPNALNGDFSTIMSNHDFEHIKKFFGLEEETDYTLPGNRRKLKYGYCLAITDPDTDGKHILGLLLLLFMCRYMSLVVAGFVRFLRVPVIRVKKNGYKVSFYTYTSYQNWRDTLLGRSEDPDSWVHHYFKGLGTSTKEQVGEDFQANKVITFNLDPAAVDTMTMAFHKKKTSERKQWILTWVHHLIERIDVEAYVQYPITAFIHHELVEFADEAIERAIPQLIDALKEAQRKAFFASRKRLIGSKREQMKTAQIAHHAAEITAYKHGEHCLADAITNMSFDFPGTNNMPLITGVGSCGSRVEGGKDAAADRYTFAKLPWWIHLVFRKEDNPLLKRIMDEGEEREVERYYPILPMILINGATGVGVGWSTEVPTHNPVHLAFWIQQRLKQLLQPNQGHLLPEIYPWYRYWTGTVVPGTDGRFITRGHFEIQGNDVIVRELPIGVWTDKYKDRLEKWIDEGFITDYKNYSDETTVMFRLQGMKDTPTYKNLDLIANHTYSNMTVLTPTGPNGHLVPTTFNRLEDILSAFFTERLKVYYQRKAHQLQAILDKITELHLRLKLIMAVRDDKIVIKNQPRAVIKQAVELNGFTYSLFKSIGSDEYNDDAVRSLEEEIQKLTGEYSGLENQPPEYIWYSELEHFIQEWCKKEKFPLPSFEDCRAHIPTPVFNIVG